MEAEQLEYHKNVIAKFEEILSRYSIRENNELHSIAFDVKQSHAVLLSEVAPNCPSCKSGNTKLVKVTKNNGIIGTGYRSYVTDQYYSCKNCGTRFDKL